MITQKIGGVVEVIAEGVEDSRGVAEDEEESECQQCNHEEDGSEDVEYVAERHLIEDWEYDKDKKVKQDKRNNNAIQKN